MFFEFPDEPELFGIDTQFLIGRDILVTPVLTPNVSTVDGIFPGRGQVTWRDWYTHDVVNTTSGTKTTLAAPLGHINVHVRDGAAILMHAAPAYTITETRKGPYSLLVSQAADGSAFGTAYIDDGETLPPTPFTTLTFKATKGRLDIMSHGSFKVDQKLDTVTILGTAQPSEVRIHGHAVQGWKYLSAQQKLVINKVGLDLNGAAVITWV